MNPILRFGSLLAISLALSGCVSVPRPAVRQDGTWCFQSAKKRLCTLTPVPSEAEEQEAKSFLPVPSKHVVWIIRNDWWDADGRAQLRVGTTQIETLPRTVSRVELPAGTAQVSIAERPGQPAQTLTLSPSTHSFVALEYQWGLLHTSFRLVELDAQSGQALATRSKLIHDIKVP